MANDIALAWPVALHVVFIAGLVAWRGPWAWGAEAAHAGLTALWEEIVFRGIILSILLPRGGASAAFGSAGLFAAVHFMKAAREESILAASWEIAWPFGVGLLYAGILLRTGTIWIGVLAHALMNLLRAAAVKPLTWTGWLVSGEPVDWSVLLALYVACAVSLLWPGRLRRRIAVGAGAVFMAMLVVGVATGGPRPGWNGPPLNATLSLSFGEAGAEGWREYRYRLAYPPRGATVLRFSVRFDHRDGEIRGPPARAGGKEWPLVGDDATVAWEGGAAPVTEYAFSSREALPRTMPFRVDYVDPYGWTRAWVGALELAE